MIIVTVIFLNGETYSFVACLRTRSYKENQNEWYAVNVKSSLASNTSTKHWLNFILILIFSFTALITYTGLIGHTHAGQEEKEEEEQPSPFVLERDIDLDDESDLAYYYGYVVPKIKFDVIGERFDYIYEHLIFKDKLPFHVQSSVRNTLNYIPILNRIGKLFRARVKEIYNFDLAQMRVRTFNTKKIRDLVSAKFPLINIDGMPTYQIEDMMYILLDIINAEFMQHRGFKKPVFFAGFVPEETANAYAARHTFLDDSLFSGSIFHGKLPHVLQAAVFMAYSGEDQRYFESIISNGYWGALFDSSRYYDIVESPEKCNERTGIHKSICRIQAREIANGHSAAIVSQWLYKNHFSNIAYMALLIEHDPSAVTNLLDHLGLSVRKGFTPQQELVELHDNLISIENFAIADFNNDFRVLFDYVKEHLNMMYNRSHFFRYLTLMDYFKGELFLTFDNIQYIKKIFKDSQIPEEALFLWNHIESWNYIANLYEVSSLTSEYNRDVMSAILSVVFTGDMTAFSPPLSQMLLPIRRLWLKKRTTFTILEDAPDYIIYRYTEPDEKK